MQKINKKHKIILAAVLGIIVIIVGMYSIISADDPGSDNDPLVSVSYIKKQVIPEIKTYIDNRLSGNAPAEISTSAAQTFQVVEVKAGQKLIGEAGCELILRMGQADIIASAKGGVADTTAGIDLGNGVGCPSNHLLIVPLSDIRGLNVKSDALVMVKGKYRIE